MDQSIYRSIVENVSDVVILIDENSTIKYINTAAKKVFGYTPDQLIGESLLRLVPKDLRKTHKKSLQHYLETGERRLQWDCIRLPALHKSGETFQIEVSFAEFIDNDTRYFSGIIRSMAEHNRVNHALM